VTQISYLHNQFS